MSLVNKIKKIGAWLVLFFGSILFFAIFSFALYFWIFYQSTINQSSKIAVSMFFIIVSIAVLIIGISVFETILDTTEDEKEKVKTGDHQTITR